MKIYFDNNATTPVDPQVKEAMDPFLSGLFANPSSPYESGGQVRRLVEQARCHMAQLLGTRSEREIIFTSGGTESNNTAIRSALKLFPHKKKIITSAVEHSSVKNLCEHLSKEGYHVVSVGVSKAGSFNWNQLIESLGDDVAIVSVMWANNETGVLFPIQDIGRELKRRNILFHVDAVQAIGKIPIHLNKMEIDYLSFSAHKIHGPKGIGALYVREGSPFQAFILGGRQERDRRAGTENVAGIIGLAKALELSQDFTPSPPPLKGREDSAKVRGGSAILLGGKGEGKINQISILRNKLEEELVARVDVSFINGKAEARIPNTTNITIPGIEAETFLIRLSQLGIEASSGSACLTGALEPSHVLMAMGHSRELASSSLRFSLSRLTTTEQIDYALEVVPKLVCELRKLNEVENFPPPLWGRTKVGG